MTNVQPKVAAAGVAGALSTIVVFLLGQFGVQVTPEVASALTTLFAFGAGYALPSGRDS